MLRDMSFNLGSWYIAEVMNPISYVKKGMSRDGHIRHFFHRPLKAYTTGTRKRRKVLKDKNGYETRWHKTGKTRPLLVSGTVKGHKKILVLYTNYGPQRKPEKTNWVMHQYHLGINKEEKDGELVLSKVFYQTQPRQFGTATKASPITMGCFRFQDHYPGHQHHDVVSREEIQSGSSRNNAKRLQFQLIQDSANIEVGDGCTYIQFASGASKGKLASN